jgi:hypothetical protein
MREDDIRSAIENLSGNLFERFARELLRLELYPGLNPTSQSHDLGEDARTEASVAFLHNEKMVSVIASKTAKIAKLRSDCKRCRDTERRIDIVIFATAGNPRTTTQNRWRKTIKEEFGWDLEVRTIDWLVPAASAPCHEKLVDDYLQVPPLGGDFVDTIEEQFSRHTVRSLDTIRLTIPGLADPLPRGEIDRCENQLRGNSPVVLTGEMGSGKSGIGKMLAQSAIERGLEVLLLDARRVAYVNSEADLRSHLDLRGSIRSAIARVGQYKGCRFIVDQLDYVADTVAADRLVELLIDCLGLGGVEVVAISRKQESLEFTLLKPLLDKGFVEVVSHPLNEDEAQDVLKQMGIPDPTDELVGLGRNLLNLEIIGTIHEREPCLDFSSITDEVGLWEQYRKSLLEREGEEVLAEAISLARNGLLHPERMLELRYPRTHTQARLVSGGIIICVQGRIARFFHEKFQDYLYAWDATERGKMLADVLTDIGRHRARNVMTWMDLIYAKTGSSFRSEFLKELFNAKC